MSNILIVEDEKRIRDIVSEYFTDKDHQVFEAENGKVALDIIARESLDIVILDIMMPEMDGFSTCRRIRKSSDIPIIMLTARSDEDDKLMGFELGADEYVTKPFSPKVLVARAEKLIHRSSGQAQTNHLIQVGDLTVDKKAYHIRNSEQVFELTKKEYDILLYMIENMDMVITRDMFLNKIWGYDYYGDDRIVDAHIKKIRRKLGDYSSYVTTVLNVGYKFVAK